MSGTEIVVYAVFVAPMAALLIVNYFKVDEIVAKPRTRNAPRGLVSAVKSSEGPVCIDPGRSGYAGRRRINRKIAAGRERRRNRASAIRFNGTSSK